MAYDDNCSPASDQERAIPWSEDVAGHARLSRQFDELMAAMGSRIVGPGEAAAMPTTVTVMGRPSIRRHRTGTNTSPAGAGRGVIPHRESGNRRGDGKLSPEAAAMQGESTVEIDRRSSMIDAQRQFISSFIVAYGRLEATSRGQDELHIVLADRLTERVGLQVAVGDYASGSIFVRAKSCEVQVNRLPRGVARDALLRLVEERFGDLGQVDLVVQAERMAGEVDQTWPWEWRAGDHGGALLVDAATASPRLYSWSREDEGAPQFHAEALQRVGVDDHRAIRLLIQPTGVCHGVDAAVSELLPKLDPRLSGSPESHGLIDFTRLDDARDTPAAGGASRGGGAIGGEHRGPSAVTHAFVAIKFAPSSCPACERRFDTPQSFSLWAGNRGASFAEARALQFPLYPELYERVDEPGTSSAWRSLDRVDFISCTRCANKTLRIVMDERTVGTRVEAEQLVGEDHYTCVGECEILGSLEDRQRAERRAREQDTA